MPISKKLALSDDQFDDLMATSWNMRIATVGPGTKINVTPMWFGWADGKIFTYGRGQKVVNVRRNPECTIIVDRNEKFPELQAAMFQGTARVLESADEETSESGMEEVRKQMGIKYAGGHGNPVSADPEPNKATAAGKLGRWIVFTPDRLVSWDNFKLKDLRKK
ncbi:MAG: pyridoxamine 5'-phosphate oxidase family protein [Pseudomonadales bacterium]|jgi:nitroimidazol reductase NimA-like FMN-containing flavoprotein (pyridoxamine 5'-phosphate oxidase superfamily)